MNRGKGSPRRGRPNPKRERTILIALLVAIALLLGALVALLPGDVGDESQLVRERDRRVPGRAGSSGTGPEAEPGSGPEEPSPPTPRDRRVTEDRTETQADGIESPGTPTEAYPDGETGARGATHPRSGELWWLPEPEDASSPRGELFVVLDDAGNSLDGYDAFLAFPGPLAVAVLPRLDFSVQAAAMAISAGKEVLLHQPMEAIGGADPGPGWVGPALDEAAIARELAENLATVPGAVGVNNHMGSLATADERVMRAVLSELAERDLFFLDSRTTAETVVREVAGEVGIPFVERHVFLDHERSRESIFASVREALERSLAGEPVVMIGHVTVPLVAEILAEIYPVVVEHGYRFAPISTLARPAKIAEQGE